MNVTDLYVVVDIVFFFGTKKPKFGLQLILDYS